MNYTPYLFLSREDDDDVRGIGKHDFRWVNGNRRKRHFLLLLLLLSRTGVNRMTTGWAIQFKVTLEDFSE